MKLARPSTAVYRGLAFLLAVAIALPSRGVLSAPGDIFTVAAPVLGADPPKAAELKAGDISVATATGAASYSYPITVPPGRNGLAPKLSLVYSSQSATYGGVAAGWSLPIGMIREDTSSGRLRTHDPFVEVFQADPGLDDEFVSTIAGESRLVVSNEPAAAGVYRTYRVAYNDASFARYERMLSGQAMRWRVRTTDGTTMLFGETSLAPGCPIYDGFAPLTRVTDPFGNEMTYTYTSIAGECVLSDIAYGQNPAAGVPSFANIHFAVHGPDAGSQTSWRSGQKIVTGLYPIQNINITAIDPTTRIAVHTRRIVLTYSYPTGSSSPIRLLTSIQESASGVDAPFVTYPAVTFEYGDPVVNLNTQVQQAIPWGPIGPSPNNLGWGYRHVDDRWPSVEALMVDLDGDGLQDRLLNAFDGSSCKYQWQRNLGKNVSTGQIGFSPPSAPVALPRLKWKANASTASMGGTDLEGCSLNGQVTTYQNANGGTFTTCHDNTACVFGSNANDTTLYCRPGGTECPPGRGGGGPGPFRTQLAYRWTDMDGDGLTDLIAGVHGWVGWYDLDYASFPLGNVGPESPPFGPWPACPGAMDRCAELDPACVQPTCSGSAPCSVSATTVNTCLAAAKKLGCNHLIRYPDLIFSPPPGGGVPPTIRGPYTRCEGLYPWIIYKNLGNGTLATTPTIKYMPLPLEAEQAEANFSGPVWTSQRHAVMDFDGDGRIDLVVHPRGLDSQISNVWWWYVWLGDGSGGVEPTRHLFQSRIDGSISGIGTDGAGSPLSTEGLVDINGDGLLDHWLKLSSGTNANVAINTGTGHRILGYTETAGEITTPVGVRPGNDAKSTITTPSPYTGGNIIRGETVATNRVVDVDNDGRADVAVLPSSSPPIVYFNTGGNYATTGVTYPGAANGLQSRKIADNPTTVLTWESRYDLADFDGDGIAESTTVTDDALFYRHVHAGVAPPRLLTKVRNGRGLDVRVTYGHMHDSTVVEQHPESQWPDARPKATPQTQWVVKQLIADDEFAAVGSTTTYFYRNPRHGADDRGRYAFRGFDEVITTAPSGAKTVERYAFDTDWSGRLIRTLTIPAEAPTQVRSIAQNTWIQKQLFGGAVRAILPEKNKSYICANGQNESQCIAAPNAYSETEKLYSSLSSTTSATVPLLWTVTTETLRSSATPGNGDRRTVTTYALAADTANYRLRPLLSTRDEQIAGAWVTFAKSGTEWDATYRVPAYQRLWVDAINEARTYFTYDMTTGNVLTRRKPVQGQAGPALTYAYDTRKLFATTETNELGHVTEFIYEYGTGPKLETRGPNIAADATKETHRIRIDGMGRTIEELASISLTGSTYSSIQQLGTTAYVEANTTTLPHTMASVTTRRQISAGGTTSTQQKVELDGHGRPKKTTVFVQGTAPVDHITTYTFGPAQTLLTVSVPDPSTNGSATVDYTYTYDSLGRPLTMRRPDSAALATRSGVDMAYDGVTKTSTEVVGAAGGQPASTKTIADAFGRILQVHEQTGASTWAVTTYTYSADDNVSTIVDPGGVTTALTHDYAGRRTQIARHGRIWKYGYDLNGNMMSEQVPGSTGVLTDPDYTTTTAYDALDRAASRIIGQRALSAADQQAFGSRTEIFTYDTGNNGKGRLARWETFAPSATTATTREDLTYDALGNRTNLAQTFNGASYTNLQRSFYREANLLGSPTLTRYQDALGGTNTTESTHIYDARGLPQRIDLVRTGEPTLALGVQTRNVAGLVTLRRTDTTGAMTYIESAWSYDKLGRVGSQIVRKGPSATQVARQDLTYFGNDDPVTLGHAIGSNTKNFSFGYDKRHQLASANETTTTGYFTSSYNYGTAGRFTNVNIAQTAPPAGSELKQRNVDYVYGDADPERVTALNQAGSSTRYATYT
jgi:YD repeat-containing protein